MVCHNGKTIIMYSFEMNFQSDLFDTGNFVTKAELASQAFSKVITKSIDKSHIHQRRLPHNLGWTLTWYFLNLISGHVAFQVSDHVCETRVFCSTKMFTALIGNISILGEKGFNSSLTLIEIFPFVFVGNSCVLLPVWPQKILPILQITNINRGRNSLQILWKGKI